ncbi:LOW QUALITY PROTEIN: proline-rich protein 14 [Leptodactylus fuscus]
MTSRKESPRHHRRKRLLIYRPSPGDSATLSPGRRAWPDEDSPRGLPRTLLLASPMERERRRVLSVELRDIGHEVEQLQLKTPPCERIETIFEEPILKGGTLVLTSQRPLRRIMIDGGSAPRRRKKKGKSTGRRYPAATLRNTVNYELLLQHKLSQLEAELQQDLSEP